MRELKKIKTKSGVEVEIKTYITLGEAREIQAVFMENVEIGIDEAGKPKMTGMKGSVANKAQDKAIEVLVASVNGKTENVLQGILDLPDEDGKEILNELDKIQNPLPAEKKTN